ADAKWSLDQIDQILSDPEIQRLMEPGAEWWADREYDLAEAEWMAANPRIVSRHSLWILTLPEHASELQKLPGPRNLLDQLSALRCYRLRLIIDDFPNSTRDLLRKFRPPIKVADTAAA